MRSKILVLEPPVADRLLPSQGTFSATRASKPRRTPCVADLWRSRTRTPDVPHPAVDALRTGVGASDIAERRPSSTASRGRGWRDPATLPLPLLYPRGRLVAEPHPPTVAVPSCVPTALPELFGSRRTCPTLPRLTARSRWQLNTRSSLSVITRTPNQTHAHGHRTRRPTAISRKY